MKGKIVYLDEPKKLKMKEYTVPEPVGSNGVLLEVLQTNVCGSEVHSFLGHHPSKKSGGGIGHEMVGRIVKLGKNIETDHAGTPIKVGDRVVPVYFLTCNKCQSCVRGDLHHCEDNFKYRGKHDEYPHFHGATYATHYYIHPEQYFFRVPDKVSTQEASSANCALSQVIYGIEHLDLKFGNTVVIQGAGGLGLNACSVAKEKGGKVIVLDGVPARLEIAKRFGADCVININEYNTLEKRVEQINKLTNGLGADFGIEVTGVAIAFTEGFHFIRENGKYVVMGNIGTDKVEVEPGLLVRKSIHVFPINRYNPSYLYNALQFLERNSKKYPFSDLLDATFSLDEIQTAIEKSMRKEVTRATILVTTN